MSSLSTSKPTFEAEINDIKAKSKSNMDDGEIEIEKQKWLQNKINSFLFLKDVRRFFILNKCLTDIEKGIKLFRRKCNNFIDFIK